VSRIGKIIAQFNHMLAEAKATAGGKPVSLLASGRDLASLIAELKSRTLNITALQKKLNACTNLGKQKDAMIARRDRSLSKAHEYIEQLKADIHEVKGQSVERPVEAEA